MTNATTSPATDTPAGSHAPGSEACSWFPAYWRAFGPKGLVVLAWWTGALMAQQLRERQRSFPLLAVVGEAGAGKGSLSGFLHGLLGRLGYQGADPAAATRAAMSRVLYEVENRPVVLTPWRGTHLRGAIVEELQQCYQGRPVQVRNYGFVGNQRVEQFRGGLAIVQVDPVSANPSLTARLVEVELTRAHHSDDSTAALRELYSLPAAQLSQFVPLVDACSADLLRVLAKVAPEHFDVIKQAVPGVHDRVAYNHAQLAALLAVLSLLLPMAADHQLGMAMTEVFGMASRANAALTVQAAA